MNEIHSSEPHAGAPRRIAVFRALQLGDMLCAVPALRALRMGEPQAHITLIGLPWAESFVQRFDRYVDDFMPFPGAPGLPEQPVDAMRLARFLVDARARRFDLAIQLHGSGTFSNAVVAGLGAHRMAGFTPPDDIAPARPGRWLAWPERLHEIARYLALMRHLGYSDWGDHLEFPLGVLDHAAWQALSETHGLHAGDYVCIHPGARMPSRRWPVARYAAAAGALAAAGLRVVLTGTKAEVPLAREFAAHMRQPFVDLCGRTSLGALAVLIARSRLLLCNDTGVSHMAAALCVPSVVVSCGSEAERWAPLDRDRHVVLAHHPSCRPCMYHACPFGHPCATAIEVRDVVRTALRLAAREASDAA